MIDKRKIVKKVGIIQVRTASKRLPEKCLLKIFGKTVLEHILQRVQHASLLDEVCIATTNKTEDDRIETIGAAHRVNVYRGSEHDVLDRFYQAAKECRADIICRITADDPFKDPRIIDSYMRIFLDNAYDYISNTIIPSYPEGMDIEVFSFLALEKSWAESLKPSQREHVTPYIWNNPHLFRILNIKNDINLSTLRWTLDNPLDWIVIQQVYDLLYHENEVFLMEDILRILDQYPLLKTINAGTIRNEGYLKSIADEKIDKQ